MVDHLATLLKAATVVPAVNQIEVHPYFDALIDPGDAAPEHAEVQELNPALAGITIYGDRLPAPVLALSGVEAPAQQ